MDLSVLALIESENHRLTIEAACEAKRLVLGRGFAVLWTPRKGLVEYRSLAALRADYGRLMDRDDWQEEVA